MFPARLKEKEKVEAAERVSLRHPSALTPYTLTGTY